MTCEFFKYNFYKKLCFYIKNAKIVLCLINKIYFNTLALKFFHFCVILA